MPAPVVAVVQTIGGRQSRLPASSSMPSRSLHGLGRAGAVGLVDDEHVGDLEQAGLRGLHRVAPSRVHDDDRRVGVPRDLDLDLADPDGLDQDPRCPDRVEHADRLRRRDATARRGARASPSTG